MNEFTEALELVGLVRVEIDHMTDPSRAVLARPSPLMASRPGQSPHLSITYQPSR